jgi:hypothetical protein
MGHGILAPDRVNEDDLEIRGLTDDMGLYHEYEMLVCHECAGCAGCKTLDDEFCAHVKCSCGVLNHGRFVAIVTKGVKVPFYEITFETGRSSVAFYEDDAEALSATGEQHRRAVNGEVAGPIGGPAERVKKVRVYDKHPNEYNAEGTMSSDVAAKEVTSLIKRLEDENKVVDLGMLSAEVRGLTHPMVVVKEAAFDSNFRMEEDRELALPFTEEA